MTQLNKQQIEHIAHLARLNCTDEELAKYSEQLTDILNFVEQLSEKNYAEHNYDYQVAGLANKTRSDVVEGCPEDMRDVTVEAFPEKNGDLLQVPGVFGGKK